jgi:phosphate transport system substrate-binding protein
MLEPVKCLCLLLLTACFWPLRASEPLTVSGCSISNVGYLNELTRDYEKKTGQRILVRGGGSLAGLTELGADRVDFAASCKAHGPEDPPNLLFIPVAWDALVFIVHPSNRITHLTAQNIRDIYDGKVANWKELGGADLPVQSYISTPMGMGGIGEALTKYFLNGRWPQVTGNSCLQSVSGALWEQMVERTPEGFASTGFDSAQKRKVKLLAVNGVVPTRAAILSGRYPYKRYLYLVSAPDAKPEVKKFIEFALSRQGQNLIASYGTIPLAAMK